MGKERYRLQADSLLVMTRVIARLDIKSNDLIKGIRFEGLRKIGDPKTAAALYFENGIDEILLVDTVASLYGRNHLGPLLEKVAEELFVPLTVAGGIRTVDDARKMFRLGADKVAVNTASFGQPGLLSEIARTFGSQSVVGSIQAVRRGSDWECLVEQGRERTGVALRDRIRTLLDSGVGEILVTSVDNDGVRAGFDLELAETAVSLSSAPVVIGGGCGEISHATKAAEIAGLSGIALGSALHFGHVSISALKEQIQPFGQPSKAAN